MCTALGSLGPLETEQGLHAEGVRTIQDVLQCSVQDARAVLHELRVRKRIGDHQARRRTSIHLAPAAADILFGAAAAFRIGRIPGAKRRAHLRDTEFSPLEGVRCGLRPLPHVWH